MKRCARCGVEKPSGEFRRNSKSPDGLHPYCKSCPTVYDANRYHSNPSKWRVYNKDARGRFRAWIWELKSGPCLDCGQSFHPVAMQFDHVRGTKIGEVSSMALGSRERLVAEIAKCDLVCSNCHAVRTWNRVRLSER